MKAVQAAITFLTYADLETGHRFYAEILGLPLVEDQGWAKVYRIGVNAFVGLVEARPDPVASPVGSGCLISLVVPAVADVDAWYERLKGEPGTKILGRPAMVSTIPVYSFFLEDPGGYHVEIQAFTDPEVGQRFAG